MALVFTYSPCFLICEMGIMITSAALRLPRVKMGWCPVPGLQWRLIDEGETWISSPSPALASELQVQPASHPRPPPPQSPKPHHLPLICALVETTWGPSPHPRPLPSLGCESFSHRQNMVRLKYNRIYMCAHAAFPMPSPGGKLINKTPSIIHGTPRGGMQAAGAGWTRQWNTLNNSQAVSGL